MTFILLLGGAAAIYIAMLMFRLAAVALPLYAGIGISIYLIGRDFGYPASIAAGLLVGALILVAGRALCAVLPPYYRAIVAGAFAGPAGFAGYQAAKGLAGLAIGGGYALEVLGFAGALAAAVAAWRGLGTAGRHRTRDGAIGTT
ncbi:hypothetical protein ASD67_18420 [Sphingopyxis sp. Root1497]|uniref:hypothetical protein n=1 Tax=Sphingopyxis sp. Root1497 TaxID=1736474 RepID=UPI0006F765B5|nr:hypothetical protein [Sphingopyxis sp. Root1497]KQZ61228.1 hypothetical protein ASD67_18420 [Sphingopyxis sp. Root1497]